MTSLLTIQHYVNEVNNFISDVESSNSTHYVYVARPQPWANSSGGDDDSAVPVVNGSVAQVELDVYDDLLYGKLIQPSDVNHVTRRYTWTPNTVYAAYDQRDPGLYDKNFYVMTAGVNDQLNVYKCIDNASNTASTIKPTLQTTSGTFMTGDGYTWKYMYTIDAASNSKFTSADFMPVLSNTAVQSNAVPGTIDAIRVANGGAGYAVFETGVLQSVVDNLTVKLSGDASSIDNYYTNSSIYIKSGFGAGQVREITSYDGATKNATVDLPIDTYARLDFSNSSLITSAAVGGSARQVIDSLTYSQSVGYVSAGANLIQTDTSVSGSVFTANASAVRVARFNLAENFTVGYALRDSSDTGSLKTDKVNISNSTNLGLSIVVNPGSGYSGNAAVTIVSASGTGGAANAQSNSSGKIAAVLISNSGVGFTSEPTVTVAEPTAQTFNANASVTSGVGEGSNNVISLATAQYFTVGDKIKYTVDTGNTTIGGLSNGGVYFVQFVNTTVVALSSTSNTAAGNRVALTKGFTETGHRLQGVTATARILPVSMYAVNAAAGAALSGDYASGDFIRVGQNANTNIRRVESVNSTIIVVNSPFANSLASANTFKLSTALIPDSIAVSEANGTISNTNLNSVKMTVTNTSVVDAKFIVGERVDFVTSSNASLNANGVVAYANASTLFLSGVNGTWTSGYRIRGSSSELTADIVTVDSRPNVTLKNPSGSFLLGTKVNFYTATGSDGGSALLIGATNLTENNSVDYQVGPTVKIVGDGTGAIAVATVDTSIGSGNAVTGIAMVDVGRDYTKASVSIYANGMYGSGAAGSPVISPLNGHGSDPYSELGARYAGIKVKFDTAENESWYYPSEASFRKIGILRTPSFANVVLTTAEYDSATLSLTDQSGTWEAGEVVYQSTSNATGSVVSGNSTSLTLSDVRGSFTQYNTVHGFTSGAAANVSAVDVLRFQAGEKVVQDTTGAVGTVVSLVSNSALRLTGVVGSVSNGYSVVGQTTGARAVVNAISSADGTRNLSDSFALRFNQTSRVTLSSNTGAFTNSEYVVQSTSNAYGRIISVSSDLDFTVNTAIGSISVGDTLVNANTAALAKVIMANSSYVKVTGVSNAAAFAANSQINNGLGASATIQEVRPALILSDVSKSAKFQAGTYGVTGQNSGAVGTVSAVTNPDLMRESGHVMYVENSNTVINRSLTVTSNATLSTTEEVRLVIKF